MAIKIYRPLTPAKRQTSVLINKKLSKQAPLKSLIMIRKKHAGRNSQGKISVRHQGGGAKKFLRIVDFRQDKLDVAGRVERLEYDPNRNGSLALVVYADGERRYILAPDNLQVGDQVVSSAKKVPVKPANRSRLKNIPISTMVYNVELEPGKGGQMARSAGNSIMLMGLDQGMAQLKMPSGEIRLVSEECSASIGMSSNPEYRNIRWGKAGRMRHRGIRPTVRGKVMNPVDHPHGGGEGHNPIGMKHPKTYTGKRAYGVKTRKHNKPSNKFILSRRKTRENK